MPLQPSVFFLISGKLWLMKVQLTKEYFLQPGDLYVHISGKPERFVLEGRGIFIYFLSNCLYHMQTLLFGDPLPELPCYTLLIVLKLFSLN